MQTPSGLLRLIRREGATEEETRKTDGGEEKKKRKTDARQRNEEMKRRSGEDGMHAHVWNDLTLEV